MSTELRIVKTAGPIRLVDGQRIGLRRYGVPPGGAFDPFAATLANALVGNNNGGTVIELAFGSLEFHVDGPAALAAVGSPIIVEGAGLLWDGCGLAFLPRPGSYSIRLAEGSVRTFLTVENGFGSVEGSLADRSVSVRKRIGPGVQFDYLGSLSSGPIRVVLTNGEVGAPSIDELNCVVDKSSSRVGVRLAGGGMRLEPERRSAPSCFGLVQCTPDGTLLIHGPDGPVTGGYARIGYVCGADIPRLAYLAPGESVRFMAIEREVSLEESRAWAESLASLEAQLRYSVGLG